PVAGIDLVEVAPDYDHSGSTAILAAQVLLNLLGFVFHARTSGVLAAPRP
ncbi:MAG: arginase family protein, partial [Rhodobacter sp.]|nr:arginase family protein [Rhodobacter sp.]